MSKAFTEEEVPVQEVYFQPRDLNTGTDNYITRQGYEQLQAQVRELSAEHELLAASDRATDEVRLREVDHRLQIVRTRLDTAVVVDRPSNMDGRVFFGSTVTVKDEEEAEHSYQLVGVDETDAKHGKISWISPVGKALLRAKVGDFVIVKTPRGEEELEVLAVG